MNTDETLLRKLLQGGDEVYYRLDNDGRLTIDGTVVLTEDEAGRAEQLMLG